MSSNAESNMLMYLELKPEEETKLKSVDGDVWSVLLDKGIDSRALWTSQSGSRGRIIQLCITDNGPKVLFELSESELDNIEGSEIVARLKKEKGLPMSDYEPLLKIRFYGDALGSGTIPVAQLL